MFRKLISGFAVLGVSVVALGGVAGAKSVVVPPSKASADIVSIAQNDGRFTTLLAAVGCANPTVAAALTSGEQLTVSAPTDQAFQNAGLNAGNVCQALDQTTLTSVLLFHVTEGRRFSSTYCRTMSDRSRRSTRNWRDIPSPSIVPERSAGPTQVPRRKSSSRTSQQPTASSTLLIKCCFPNSGSP